jgi:hypothetical protein
MAKVVQTTLEEQEYKAFKEALKRKNLTIREGLKLAVSHVIESEFRIDERDTFFTHNPVGKSGLGDLSKKHDKYLCEEQGA